MKSLCPLIAKEGHEIILYTDGGFFQKEKYDNFTIIKLPSVKSKLFGKILLGILGTVHSLLVNRKVNIYHYNANAAALLSFLPRLFFQNVVYQGHGLEWKRAKWSKFNRFLIKKLDDFVIFNNNNITMVSQEQSDYIKVEYKKNSTTITSGVSINNKIYPKEILKKYELEEECYILYLGRLVQEKKADILIEAYLKSNLNIKLVIAGDDPNEKEYIKSLKNKAQSNKNIIFTGAVYGDDKESLLQSCKIFCIPSELEGLPITLLEAMSYKRICIASNITANKEALAKTGIYFNVNDIDDLSDKLTKIEQNKIDTENIGIQAFERIVNKFTWNTISKQFLNFYDEIINN
jgi:glycosyltransferase involved in cell wall biosynthesis